VETELEPILGNRRDLEVGIAQDPHVAVDRTIVAGGAPGNDLLRMSYIRLPSIPSSIEDALTRQFAKRLAGGAIETLTKMSRISMIACVQFDLNIHAILYDRPAVCCDGDRFDRLAPAHRSAVA